jgi:proteasome alpha subunit
MGGAADQVASYLKERYVEGASLTDALHLAVAALGHTDADDRVIAIEDLEVAVLDRTRTRSRKFSRLRPTRLAELLSDRGPVSPPADAHPDATDSASVPDPAPQESSTPPDNEPPVAPPVS